MSELKTLMQNAGIVGAGGAGFPSYAKLADGADTLVINGAECEPLIYTDFYLMHEHFDEFLHGINLVLDGGNIPKCVIGIKEHTAERLGLSDWQHLSERISVRTMPNAYPMGDEINLIYQVTGRVVSPGALPITAGVIVYNVETVYNIAKAEKGENLTEKWITVGGDISNRKIIRTPIGMAVKDIFKNLGITVPDTHIVIDGGPSMGKIINYESAVVTKTTKSILILPKNIPAVTGKMASPKTHNTHAQSNCCQCTRCTDMCPRALLGYPLEPHRLVRSVLSVAEADPEIIKTASLCCSCGVCEIAACCQGISPRAVIEQLKGILAKNRIKYVSDKTPTVNPQRDYRLMPSERWMELLGVHKMDKMPEFAPEMQKTNKVKLLLKQSIGAPVTPTVGIGDTVKKGDLIATNDGGLFAPLHASIDGKVTAIDSVSIEIEKTEGVR